MNNLPLANRNKQNLCSGFDLVGFGTQNAAAIDEDSDEDTSHHSDSQNHRYESMMMTMIINIFITLLSTAGNIMRNDE